MKRKFSYSIGEMNRRLLAIGKSIRGYLVISTLSSIIGALAHMGLMGFGALWLLAAAGFCGNFALYGILTVGCAILIAVPFREAHRAHLTAHPLGKYRDFEERFWRFQYAGALLPKGVHSSDPYRYHTHPEVSQ